MHCHLLRHGIMAHMEPITATLVKAGADLAAERVKGFLQKLLGPAVEEAGLILQEHVRQYRLQNQIKILGKAQGMLDKAHISPAAVPLKTLLPLLENASLEQEADLQAKWAALLANASIEANAVLPGFVEILKQLSPAEARLLDGMWERICAELNRVYEEVDPSMARFLGTAGLYHDQIGTLAVELGLSAVPWVKLETRLDDTAPADVRAQRIRLGTALDNLMRLGLIFTERGRKYRDKYFISTLGYEFVGACREPAPNP